ncbi:hypothetical protein DZ860_16695 [Vibrio sinensis]|uniref:Uncharacterized protein n=1 Tax=Vibrio sinensis TaxID=2302434 RepID=A0A3A6Q9R7_9VIBR|nr:hypothetical protein [Vibrio sinensis]RJX68634.1 hypothetical protein DZ860_16695 [Vibrio sinensis]
MKIYKLRVTDAGYSDLTRDSFEEQTNLMPPWFDHQADKERHFAVCPACNNSTQIMNLYHESEPLYAKHNLSVTVGLQNEIALSYCPYYTKRPRLTLEARRVREDETSIQIMQCLIENFDKVAFLIKETIGLLYSKGQLQKMLDVYHNSRGWLYSGANLLNVPWIFLYQARSQNVAGMRIYKEEIRAAMLRYNDRLTFNEYNNVIFPKGEFIELNISFIHHKQTIVNERLTETLELNITGRKNVLVYSELITFHHERFSGLVNSKNEQFRQYDLVEMARSMLN